MEYLGMADLQPAAFMANPSPATSAMVTGSRRKAPLGPARNLPPE
jgi:hypothetical protein